ncbi:coiled coil protein [Cryptosporidium felis]|nr:coiled coil protein [Cryptosporidium felis]
MSLTSRTNTLFTLPGASQYVKSNTLNTVVDSLEFEEQLEQLKPGSSENSSYGIKNKSKVDSLKAESISKRVCEPVKTNKKDSNNLRNINSNYYDLEVQLMMKNKMIEELLEENGKLIDSMSKLEQEKIDETNRVQQGTEMLLQQVVEDNEWYKAQFLEMKNELEKAISQTRNKGREISTLEKRCKNLIEEKETIQNFLDDLTVQYDQKVNQLRTYKNNFNNINRLVNSFIGVKKNETIGNNEVLSYSQKVTLNTVIQKIKRSIERDGNFSKIKQLVEEVEGVTAKFETEINEIFEKIHNKNRNLGDGDLANNQIEDNNLISNSEFMKIESQLQQAKNEIEQLNFEIKRKAEIIQELKDSNINTKLEILENVNNNKEDSKIKLLQEKVDTLEIEKQELIKKVANLNKRSIHITRKQSVISEEKVSFDSSNFQSPTKPFTPQETDLDNSGNNEGENNLENDTYNEEDNEDSSSSSYNLIHDPSISKIVDKYVNCPENNEGKEKREMVQRNSIQRNRYY